MNCKEIEKQIVLYSELTAKEKDAVNTHVKICPSCKELFESMVNQTTVITNAGKVKTIIEDPQRVTASIMKQIEYSNARQWRLPDFILAILENRLPRYALATLSLILIALFSAEQSKSVQVSRVSVVSTPVKVNHRIKEPEWQPEVNKKRTSSLMSLTCTNPFNINKVNVACLKEKLAAHNPM